MVEHGSFTLFVFIYFGVMSRECGQFFSRTVEKIADKCKTQILIFIGTMEIEMNFFVIDLSRPARL